MRMRRVACLITARTWAWVLPGRPAVKKPPARIASAWERTNCDQAGPVRRGAGPVPAVQAPALLTEFESHSGQAHDQARLDAHTFMSYTRKAAAERGADSGQAGRRGRQACLDRPGKSAGRRRGQLYRDPCARAVVQVEEVNVERVLGAGVLRMIEVHGRVTEREPAGRALAAPGDLDPLGQVGTHSRSLSWPGNGRRSPRSSASRRSPPRPGTRASPRQRTRARRRRRCGTHVPYPVRRAPWRAQRSRPWTGRSPQRRTGRAADRKGPWTAPRRAAP